MRSPFVSDQGLLIPCHNKLDSQINSKKVPASKMVLLAFSSPRKTSVICFLKLTFEMSFLNLQVEVTTWEVAGPPHRVSTRSGVCNILASGVST